MKTLAVMLLMFLMSLAPAAAAPAAPIWSATAGSYGFDTNSFITNFPIANWLYRGTEAKYLTASANIGTGTQFNLTYGISRNDALGYDRKIIMAGVGKKINENWWVTLGYESGWNPYGSFHIGAIYNISPNAALSVTSSLNNSDYELKNVIIRTQLYIHF